MIWTIVVLVLIICVKRNCYNPSSSTSENCSFEYGMCGWNSISAGWKIGRGSNGVIGTSPLQDHTYKNETGGYLYLDSITVNPSQSQMLLSPLFHSNDSCLSLWCHMRGNDIVNLTISIETRNTKTVNRSIAANYNTRRILWSQQGELDDNWYHVQITIQTQEDIRISLDGTTTGTYGNIAVGDIQLSAYSCKDICSFDVGFCNWIPKKSVGFRWKRTPGVTSSNHKGSQSDDTNGPSRQYYMYINTSLGRAGTKAILSHAGLYRPGQACLSFRYHMSGENMGNLTLYTRRNDDTANPVWHKSGDQGNNWISADVDLNVGPNLIVEFEAIRGNGGHGDISLDDTSLTTGYCNDVDWKKLVANISSCKPLQNYWNKCGRNNVKYDICMSQEREHARGLKASTDGEETKQNKGSLIESSVTQSHPTRSGSHTTTQRYNSTDTVCVPIYVIPVIIGTVAVIIFMTAGLARVHRRNTNGSEPARRHEPKGCDTDQYITPIAVEKPPPVDEIDLVQPGRSNTIANVHFDSGTQLLQNTHVLCNDDYEIVGTPRTDYENLGPAV